MYTNRKICKEFVCEEIFLNHSCTYRPLLKFTLDLTDKSYSYLGEAKHM